MPVILTAPHGGRDEVPGCPVRTPAGPRFVVTADFNTDVLALGIAGELERLTGRRPYLVLAKFHRRFIDANRPAEEAYSAPGCEGDFNAYHASTRRFVDEVRARHRHGMLFDVHGQSAYRDSILRGTRYGATVKALLARAGPPAVTGPDSVFGRFVAMGYRILPPNELPPTARAEERNYTGGYTVAVYGSRHADGIDAMQLEFGRDLREAGVVAKTARDTAAAIAAFHEAFLR
ncbi:MAG: N-formylglutamate amidohydrolase [Burkholderiales bacterium]|nr:N-formylglutamate amidohydrolase [Burkholderiales bacterium]